ncbi:MAG: WHG domain-containing protein [Deltaproteobacteria bacterium]|nr:WHG domain-containing protein [Deltaproteobacteria bacterium]
MTSEEVVAAAVEVLHREGFRELTARKVARQLGVSTMPLFSCFQAMDSLVEAVEQEVTRRMKEYQRRPYTPNPMLNIGVGYVLFAQEHPRLLEFMLFRQPASPRSPEEGLAEAVRDILADHDQHHPVVGMVMEGTADGPDLDLLVKGRVFAHGLAMLALTGELGAMPQSEIIRLLQEAGEAFMGWKKSQEEKHTGR